MFARKGDDLYLTQEIAFSQAALGDEIEIPALEGTQILLTVPAGTESGRILRVSGKGVPNFGSQLGYNIYTGKAQRINKENWEPLLEAISLSIASIMSLRSQRDAILNCSSFGVNHEIPSPGRSVALLITIA